MFYKGHSEIGKDGCVEALNEFEELIQIESFLLKCSAIPGVHTIGIFDCCRQNRSSKLNMKPAAPTGDYHSIFSAYREAHSEYISRECPCSGNQASESLAEKFFSHVKGKQDEKIYDVLDSFGEQNMTFFKGWAEISPNYQRRRLEVDDGYNSEPSFFPRDTEREYAMVYKDEHLMEDEIDDLEAPLLDKG